MPGKRVFANLLDDANFKRLVREMSRRSLPWEEFLGFPQPSNMSPLESWHALSKLSQCVAVPVPIPDFDLNPFWYRRTHEIDDGVRVVSCACRSGSHLNEVIGGGAGQHFLTRLQIEETVAAATLDGVAVQSDHAQELLRLDHSAQSDSDRLLQNTHTALARLPDLVDEPFSVDMFMYIRELLLKDVDLGQVQLRPASRGILMRAEDSSVDQREESAVRQMGIIADYLNRESCDPDDLVTLQGELTVDAWRYYSPLGTISSQVGRLASKLFALKNDLPVLALLPLSRAKVDWERDFIRPPMVTYDRASYAQVNERNPSDLTALQTLAVQLILVTLGQLQARVAQWEERDGEMRRLLFDEPLLNQRQRSILGRALRAPAAEFRIRYHQKNHGIHYTTARRDLLELFERDYLVMEQRGKAFVFSRGPRLDELEADRLS